MVDRAPGEWARTRTDWLACEDRQREMVIDQAPPHAPQASYRSPEGGPQDGDDRSSTTRRKRSCSTRVTSARARRQPSGRGARRRGRMRRPARWLRGAGDRNAAREPLGDDEDGAGSTAAHLGHSQLSGRHGAAQYHLRGQPGPVINTGPQGPVGRRSASGASRPCTARPGSRGREQGAGQVRQRSEARPPAQAMKNAGDCQAWDPTPTAAGPEPWPAA